MFVRPLQGRQVAERIAHVVLDVGPAGHEARELLQLWLVPITTRIH